MPASRASTLLGSTPLTKQALAEKAINQEEKFGSLKDMSPEEKEAQLPGGILPSGKLLHFANWKITIFMGKSTINGPFSMLC